MASPKLPPSRNARDLYRPLMDTSLRTQQLDERPPLSGIILPPETPPMKSNAQSTNRPALIVMNEGRLARHNVLTAALLSTLQNEHRRQHGYHLFRETWAAFIRFVTRSDATQS